MNRHQGSYHYNTIDDRPMLGAADDYFQETRSNHSLENEDYEYNEEAEKEAKQLLDDFEDLLPKTSEISVIKCESPKDNHHDGPLPLWYKKKLDSKIREAKDRLELLSNIVCNYCPSVAAHIKRIEQDHSATFCKMDFPRHPSLNKPWTNSWKFNCTVKCKETGNPTHSHTGSCESQVVLEHVDTGVSMETLNICANEYPEFVMDVVELFQYFANEQFRKALDTAYESTVWTGIKLVVRSNYENKLMIVVRGKKIGSLKYQLRKFFESGPGRDSNVISVSCIDQTWRKNINKVDAEHIHGLFKLKDKIGSVSIEYKPKISVDFNSIEIAQLGKIIKDYAGLTMETTLLDIGCSFGILSLIMSHECERVIGLNTMHSVSNELNQAEDVKRLNKIENVSFIGCNPENVITQCSPFVKGYITVAVLNLASPFGKSKYTMDALRNIPSIWRVIAYGPFTKEHRTNIVKLTTENDASGEHFLPMQGCILDKSPSVENAFDIVVLFERPSLITPKLKLEVLASGPTVNVKIDSEAGKYELSDLQEMKPKLSMDTNQNLQNAEEKYRKSPPYSSSSRSSRKYNRSPSPTISIRSPSPRRSVRSPSPRRSVRSPSPRRSQHSSSPRRSNRSPSSRRSQRSFSPRRSQRSSSPRRFQHSSSPRRSTASDRHSDHSVHKHKSHPVPPVHKEKDTTVYAPIKNEFRVKIEPKEDRLPPRNKNQSPPSSDNEKSFDYPKAETNKLQEERRDKTTPISYPSLSVRKEFQFFCPSPPRERPPSPPADTSLHIDASRIKEEGEKRSEQQTETKPKIRVKTADEINVKNEVEENDDDLRILIEQRKKLLEKLGQDKETRPYKDLPRSYKRHSSPSPSSRFSRKYKRSSSSSSRSMRSPSPYRHRSPSSKRRRRSPYRSRRSPSTNYRRSRRSPTSPVRVKREPYSPDRSKREPFSSVSNKRGDRSKKSPSTSSFKREVYGRTSHKRSRSKSPKRRKSKSPS